MDDVAAEIKLEYERRSIHFQATLQRELDATHRDSANKAVSHHWWPLGISKHWVTENDKKISLIRKDGFSKREYPKNIGCIKNHNTTSDNSNYFEAILSRLSDRKNYWLIQKVMSLKCRFSELTEDNNFIKINNDEFNDCDRQNLARYAGAMLLRNPYRSGNLSTADESFSSLGLTGYAFEAGHWAAALDKGEAYSGPTKDDLREIKDNLIDLNIKLLIAFTVYFYGSDFNFYNYKQS